MSKSGTHHIPVLRNRGGLTKCDGRGIVEDAAEVADQALVEYQIRSRRSV
jgi:hypothetical protein